jgi:hypothetical protein
MAMTLQLCSALFASALAVAAHADQARLELACPNLEVRITQSVMTQPISEVLNLASDDRLWNILI